ncbi:restriction endonuclease subunit S [Flammeovirga aprica]|uniref:Restriction endonuclease subunit S n=1 Tax=Flammeovirga aprica JL-4 TaxID=694437 RepID=A0A7X9RW83_9BACT|nr:restriction endonuclease subunit S [Flammeovirga aprica]NME69863.1 restriction endonuclease subunit S [Flammeovirga aprica JL-4]
MTAIKNNIPVLRFPEFSGKWEKKKLGQLLTFKNGVNATKEQYGRGVKFINVLDIIENNFITHDNIKGLVDIEEKEFLKNEVKYGDVLFQRSSETREEVGQANVYLDKEKSATFGGFVIRGQKISDYEPMFMNYLLKGKTARKEITTKSGGSTRYNVGQDILTDVSIKTPTLPEQQKIADFLSSVDKKIGQLSEKKLLLEEYKKGVMQQLLSREIRFKADDGSEFEEWEEKKLGELTKINQGLQIPIDKRFTSKVENSFFYITNEFLKVSSDKVYYIQNPPKNVICDESDVLMTRTGNTGQVVTGVKGAFHNNFFKIKFDRSILNKDFFVFYLRLPSTQNKILSYAGASTIPDLNHGDFYRLLLDLPSLPEQQKIANFLTSLDRKIEVVGKELEGVKEWKKGLLQGMFV